MTLDYADGLSFGDCKFKSAVRIQLALLWMLALLTEVSAQPFISDCNAVEPSHVAMNRHSYCSHACRPNMGGGGAPNFPLYACQPGGNCNCAEPCYNGAAPPPQLPPTSADLPCPNNDPANPGLTAACVALCAGACTGGTGGVLCGDTGPMLTRVCTCLCPPQPCVVPTLPTSTTTTTVSPVTIPPVVSVALLKIPAKVILKVKKKILLMLKSLFVICWFMLKLYLLQVFIIFCLKEALHHYFGIDLDIDWRDVYNMLKWLIRLWNL